MELRRRERGLAGEGLLLALAVELGYPDLEALCVAVADHTVSAEEIADTADRARRGCGDPSGGGHRETAISPDAAGRRRVGSAGPRFPAQDRSLATWALPRLLG